MFDFISASTDMRLKICWVPSDCAGEKNPNLMKIIQTNTNNYM